ncbi:MAG TPA: S8 family serine peptidase [Ornithinibacter sp.]|jgi:subtilisin family serine protease|uniref:S8 family serine peptidase n=1 Tax=Ornithinibacter sp. TaxID=2862748 RepID=UPI001B7C0BF9|nr:S8 family serine peptidase [Ornithinibacter sp.]MBP6525852.1 S8 family serine peptidase [Dermatophilaceae bacterium]HQV82595.1 S8 family serine peptidase [Ornithinibacter sp.]HQW73239.1 S8 family serine peptidase [Ornithinibacter sp.]HQX87357.1 S8 family serine peptidase [Ornithinibacter sp.]HQZ08995.1 S8 family serine peptidase [Ornithinibacter sp.]
MSRRSTQPARTALAALAAAALATGLVSTTATSAGAAEPEPRVKVTAPKATADKGTLKKKASKDKLGQHDRQLLEKARSKGEKRVTILLATEKGATKGVAASVKANGGFTGMTNDRIGYVRATVPTSAVEKVAGLAKVLAVDLNESIPLPDPTVESSGRAGATASVDAPGPSTPEVNPYMPTNEIGSVDFRTAHPTWDGRGVTIGVIDSGVDLDHPALQTTTTGERKIVDWVTATDPIFDGDGTWRRMLTEITGPSAVYAGRTWTLPSSGTYKVNAFSESITAASEPGGDVNRDGDTTDIFGVLYDSKTNDIWVDADQNFTFEAGEKMRPYKENFDVRHFGTDNPATDIVERMPFVVEFREDVDLAPFNNPALPPTADYVNIGIVEDAHGSHVAGIAAGNSLFGGAVDGQAPGAQVVSSRACTWGGGCTAAALTDGMVDLVANRGVDVVNMSIGGLPALNDGNNARARLYDALIDEYGVQLFISAGNSGAGINTIGDPSVATSVVSVASSVSKQTWLSNYGSVVSTPLTLHNYSSRGPREDGGFKPNIMAPGSAVSTVPQWLVQPGVAETGYTLPVGYAMFNGTSMASPQAAGGAALLLSAGFATGTPITPAQLRESMYTTADFVKGVEAVSQGTGQLDVPTTWSVLKNRPATRTFTTDAPVCTVISDFLATPDRGTGVYNRCAAGEGGHKVGQSKTYQVKVTRTSGASGAVAHRVRLIGNDGTFTVPSTASLRLDRAQTITVVAKPRTAGLHSAILVVDDPRTGVVDHRVMLAVVAAEDLKAPAYSLSKTGEVERNLVKRHFITVPEGTKALQVNLGGIATNSQVRWIAFNPYGVPVDSTATTQCYTNFPGSSCDANSRAYSNPIPGVWELIVESRRTSPFLDNPYRLTASAQGVTVDPAIQTVAAPIGVATPVTWTVRNDFGPVTVTPQGGNLGSALSQRPTIADAAAQEFEVAVPAGAQRLDVTIGNPSDLSADLDLTVYNAAGELVGQDADGDSEESVSIASPAPGTYTVVVDGYSVPAGNTEYDYLDVFFSSALGTLAVPGTAITLSGGQSATVTGTLTAAAPAAAGRQLFGEMTVVTPAGAVLGTGSVLVSAP